MTNPADGELLAILAKIPDPRGRKGRGHSLAAMLAATICGLLTGATGCTAIAQWIRDQEPSFWHAIGFGRKLPTANCYRSILIDLPPETLQNAISQWAQHLLGEKPVAEKHRGIAIDGKTLTADQWKGRGPYGKKTKKRVVPMFKRVQAILEPYFALNDSWFAGERQILKLVKNVANRAQIPSMVTPHVLRHTFATLAWQKGISLAAVQIELGQDRLATTEIYLNPTEGHVIEEFRNKR